MQNRAETNHERLTNLEPPVTVDDADPCPPKEGEVWTIDGRRYVVILVEWVPETDAWHATVVPEVPHG